MCYSSSKADLAKMKQLWDLLLVTIAELGKEWKRATLLSTAFAALLCLLHVQATDWRIPQNLAICLQLSWQTDGVVGIGIVGRRKTGSCGTNVTCKLRRFDKGFRALLGFAFVVSMAF